MNYFNIDHFLPESGGEPEPAVVTRTDHYDAGETARQIAALLGRCLPIPDTPELSYLRCFVTLAFEEASTIANRGQPSPEEINYIAFLEREAKAYSIAAS